MYTFSISAHKRLKYLLMLLQSMQCFFKAKVYIQFNNNIQYQLFSRSFICDTIIF